MRSIDALVPQEDTDTSKKITLDENKTADAIGELNINLKEMTDSTKESVEKITTDFQDTIKKMFEKTTSTEPKGDNE